MMIGPVAHFPHERYGVTYGDPCGERFQSAPGLAISHEHQVRRGAGLSDQGEGVEECFMVLHRHQARNATHDQRPIRNAPLYPRRRPQLIAQRLECRRIDEVGHVPDPVAPHAFTLRHGPGDLGTVREHRIRHAKRRPIAQLELAIGERVPPPPARDHHRRAREQRPRRGEDIGVHVMRMDDLHAFIPQIPGKAATTAEHAASVQAVQRQGHHGNVHGAIAVGEGTLVIQTDDPQVESFAVQPLGRSYCIELGAPDAHRIERKHHGDACDEWTRHAPPTLLRNIHIG